MKDTIHYYDRNNVLRLTLNEYPYYSEPSDLKDWIWGFNEQFGVINTFYRNKTEYELVIGIAGDYLPHHDALCDIFSADVIANEPGYLELRGWRLPCYIVEAAYEYGLSLDRQAKFRVRSVNSTWIRTNTRSYNGVPGGGLGGEDLGRDYIFSYVPPEKYEDTGEIIKIENDEEDLTLTSLEVSLSPIQEGSGEPSPDNVRPISGRTEVVTQRTGKNVLPNTSTSGSGSGITRVVNSDGTISLSGTSSGLYLGTVGTINLPSGTYIVNGCPPNSNRLTLQLRENNVNGTTLATDSGNGATLALSESKTICACTRIPNGEAISAPLTVKPMVRLASDTDDTYEPYQGTTYTTALGRTVYGGTLDVVSGVLTVDRAMVDLSILGWGVADGVRARSRVIDFTRDNGWSGDWRVTKSNVFNCVDPASVYSNRADYSFANISQNYYNFDIKVPNGAYADGTAFKSWLADVDGNGTHAYVCIELATPQTYQLTPQQISLLLGENNLWTNTGGTIDVKYETISVPFPARGYNYGYSQPESHAAVINLPGTGNGYEIIVYGPQTNPVIYLNNQPVQVNVELSAQQRLRIVSNGSVKTIEILSSSGQATDAFVYRDKENTPFLTLGTHTDLTFGQIRFDFTTIERRSEPTWT